MHDTLIIHIPIQQTFTRKVCNLTSVLGEVAHYGIDAYSKVKLDPETNLIVSCSESKHAFESLPSSYDGMSIKFYSHNVANTLPYVALNASYKFIQGHNAYGGDDIRPLAFEMLRVLKDQYPNFFAFLSIKDAKISRIDSTYSAVLSHENLIPQVIKFLSNISNGQRKKDKDRRDFYNTCYWGGKKSNRGIALAYGKGQDVIREYKELTKSANRGCSLSKKRLEIINFELIQYSKRLLRFEARTKRRTLEQLQIPFNLWEFIDYQQRNPDVLVKLWQYWFSPVFESMKGEVMTNQDDYKIECLCRKYLWTQNIKKLISGHQNVFARYKIFSFGSKTQFVLVGRISYTRANNAINFYKLLKQDGYNKLKTRYSSNAFNTAVRSLVKIGIPKAHLQNLKQDTGEEIPLIRLINIDFNKQAPDGYKPVTTEITEFNKYLPQRKQKSA